MSRCVALTKLSCAECCARITVFHKLNGSESVAVGAVFAVGCLMMTQHLSVSVENGPDLGWKNLF